ncbi:MAG: hypothetical protein ACWGN1_02185 [Desulfobulbales bacterium]
MGELLGIEVLNDKAVSDALSIHGPKNVDRAAYSALGSVGYRVAQEVKKQIYGRYGWPDKETKWRRKTRGGMRWWARFIKYRRFRAGGIANVSTFLSASVGNMGVVILPAKDTKKRIEGSYYTVMQERRSPFLKAVFHRFELGRTIAVTDKMRKRLAGGGVPIKKTTRTLYFKPRPIFKPAWQRQQHWLPAFFYNKFFDNLNRYQSGLSVRDWNDLKDAA